MYLNSFICFLIFAFALWTSFYIYREEKRSWSDMSIASFWLCAGLTWLFVGISLIVFKKGLIELDIFINQYLVQTTIFAQITLGIYYVVYRITKNKRLSFASFLLFIAASIVGLYFAYQPQSLTLVSSTYCSTEYKIDPITWNIFQAMFLFAMLGVGLDVVRNFIYKIKKSDLFEFRYFLTGIAILTYGIFGFLDQLGFSAAWITVLMRSLIVFCVGIVFIAYSHQEI